eukprot:m.431975 g.431975  ORF g.431975 m.431975 type:complete len:502 (+) comp17375_c0_seq1:4567-6072(+)
MEPWRTRQYSQKRSRTESPPTGIAMSPHKVLGFGGAAAAAAEMEEGGAAVTGHVPLGPFGGMQSLTMHHFDLPDLSDPRTPLRLDDLTEKPPPPPHDAIPPWPNTFGAGKSPVGPLPPPHKPTKAEPMSISEPSSPRNDASRVVEMSAEGYPIVSGVLRIVQQPASHGRFRYSKEGRKTPLHGREDGSYPTVAIADRYRHLVEEGTQVDVTLVTKHNDEHGSPIQHWHVLEGKEGGPVSRPLKDGVATFPNLVVTRTTAEKEGGARNVEDQHVIRLMYTMRFQDEKRRSVLARAISEPIFGQEVKIHRISHMQIPATGNIEVFFLTSKIKRKNTILTFTETTPSSFDPGPRSKWQLDKNMCLTYAMKDLTVHYQYAVVARVPPYWDQTITSPRRIKVCLIDTVQGLESNVVEIDYVPAPFRPYSSASAPPGHPPVFGMAPSVHGSWGVPQLDWFPADNAAGAAADMPMRDSSNSPSVSASSESTDTRPSRGRVYGSFETSV